MARTMVSIIGDTTHINEPKSRRSRRVVAISENTSALLCVHRRLHAEQFEALNATLTEDTQVCVRGDERLMKSDALTKGYKRIAKRRGMSDIRFHDLRHTHTSIQTTLDIYGHVMLSSDTEAGNKLDHIVGKMSA